MKSSNKLGNYIERIIRRNSDQKYGLDDVRGCSNTKSMMKTKANMLGRTFEKFLIIQPDEFVFNRRTTRNGEKIGMAFNDSNREYIFTEDYVSFRVKKECLSILNPYYLYLFFCRSEFDRYARYMSTGSATEFFNWEDMCAVPFSCPPIEQQNAIVRAYKSIIDRIALKNRINDNLESLLLSKYHLLFDNDEGKVECTIGDFGEIISGATPSTAISEYFCVDGIAWLTPKDLTVTGKRFIYKGETDISKEAYDSCSTKLLPKGTVLLTSRAPVGTVALAMNEVCTNQGFKSIVPKKKIGSAFIYFFLKDNKSLLDSHASGTTFMEISGNVLKTVLAFIPSQTKLDEFNTYCNTVFQLQNSNEIEIDRLSSIQQILISGISSR